MASVLKFRCLEWLDAIDADQMVKVIEPPYQWWFMDWLGFLDDSYWEE